MLPRYGPLKALRSWRMLSTVPMRRANLAGQVHMVIGPLGPVSQGLVSQLLNAGSTVVMPSDKHDSIAILHETLNYPAGLVTIDQSMSTKDGAMEVLEFVKQELGRLDGVVAHGGLVQGPDESQQRQSILETTPGDVMSYVQSLLVPHVVSANIMIPFLETQGSTINPSYTIVTGGLKDGRKNSAFELGWMQLGAEGPSLTSMYGFGLALRSATQKSKVRVNELRIGMDLNRSDGERMSHPRSRPLSLDIGALATYVAESDVKGKRFRASDNAALEELLHQHGAFQT